MGEAISADRSGSALSVFQRLELACDAHRTRFRRPIAQELVELVPVHHADKAVVDRHVDDAPRRRDHAGRGDLGFQEMARNGEILDQARRNGAAAGLDPPAALDHRRAIARPCELERGRRTRRASADDNSIEGGGIEGGRIRLRSWVSAGEFAGIRGVVQACHAAAPVDDMDGLGAATGWRLVRIDAHTACPLPTHRQARTAEATKPAASRRKTAP